MSRAILLELFQRLDLDSNGFLEKKEMMKAINDFPEPQYHCVMQMIAQSPNGGSRGITFETFFKGFNQFEFRALPPRKKRLSELQAGDVYLDAKETPVQVLSISSPNQTTGKRAVKSFSLFSNARQTEMCNESKLCFVPKVKTERYVLKSFDPTACTVDMETVATAETYRGDLKLNCKNLIERAKKWVGTQGSATVIVRTCMGQSKIIAVDPPMSPTRLKRARGQYVEDDVPAR